MAGNDADKALLGVCDRFGADRGHTLHVVGLCEALVCDLRHLHGLTKTSRPLVRASAFLHDIAAGDGKADHAARGRERILRLGPSSVPLTAPQRRIVAQAVALHARDTDVAGFLRELPAGRAGAMMALSARIAAVLRIADALDHSRAQQTALQAVRDDGRAVDLFVSGAPAAGADAGFALAKADLWNLLAPRPIRSVAVCDGPAPASALLRPTDTVAEAARRVMQRHLERLISRRYGLAYDEDIEYVHEMRVATRRMRAAIRVFRKAVQGGFAQERKEVKALADAFGVARDVDVFLAFLRGYAEAAPHAHRAFLNSLIRSEKRKRRRGYVQLLRRCADPAYARFTGELHRRLCRPVGADGGIAGAGKRARRPIWRHARSALRKDLRRLGDYGRRLEKLSPEQLHSLRIACKRARYTAEFFADLYPPELKQLTATMVKMQDLLGEVHDFDVYAARVQEYVRRRRPRRTEPAAARRDASAAAEAILEHLREQQAQRRDKARRAWLRFTAPKSWAAVNECVNSPLRA
jgi:CHAD domain-containing protein